MLESSPRSIVSWPSPGLRTTDPTESQRAPSGSSAPSMADEGRPRRPVPSAALPKLRLPAGQAERRRRKSAVDNRYATLAHGSGGWHDRARRARRARVAELADAPD